MLSNNNNDLNKKIKFKTFFWRDAPADNFHLGRLVVQTGEHPIKFRDIHFEQDGELFYPVITFISIKASRIKKSSHGHGMTLIFTCETISNTLPSKTEIEKQNERQEKQKEIDEFIEWYRAVHRRIMILNAIEDEKDNKKKGTFFGKTIKEIENNELLMSFVLSAKHDYHIKTLQTDDTKDPCPIMYLPLNSVDPFIHDYKRRTNFIRLDGKSTYTVQDEIVKRMFQLTSEIVPTVRFHRVTSNGGIQFRFLSAVPLGYFKPTPKVFGKQILEKYSSYETVKNFTDSEEATKDVLNGEEDDELGKKIDSFESGNENDNDSELDDSIGTTIDLNTQKPTEEFSFKKKYNNPNSKK